MEKNIMSQCSKLFNEFDGIKLDNVRVKVKGKAEDFFFSKVLMDFKRHILLGSFTVIHNNVECELIPTYNIDRISLLGEGRTIVTRKKEPSYISEPWEELEENE
jgi:hypothetical protein